MIEKVQQAILMVFMPLIGFMLILFYGGTMSMVVAVIMLFVFNIACPVASFLQLMRIPEAAVTLWRAKKKKMIPILIVHDTGRSRLDLIRERRGEGIVLTEKGLYKLIPRYIRSAAKRTFQQITKTDGEEDNPGSTKNAELEEYKELEDYRDWVTKRSFLIGLDSPIFIGYSGSLCLLNPSAMALVEAGEMHIQTPEGFYPKLPEGKTVKDIKQPLMLIDPRKAKGIINKMFDETQIAAVLADVKLLGKLDLSRFLPIILIVVVVVAALGLLLAFPDLLSGLGI